MGKRRKSISIKSICTNIVLCSLLAVFTQCASSQNTEKTAPVKVKEPYFQKWNSSIEEGGSGFLVYLPIEESSNIQLEYAYFKGKKIKLERKAREAVYVGKYVNRAKKKGYKMHVDPKKEYGNEFPESPEKIPYELKGNECVIEYTKNNKKEHFRLDNLPEKKVEGVPMQIRQ
ncbi:hypothetical protein [Aquimarina sp. MMG016]|uniref:hypothetical protein n=1 Tax=Aquimarina sp. MMG016 TaxID=2822690 RepID=UPI001B3A637B|nr:hypothetical protein [Aquimarina sp. MMG016]